MKQKLYLEGIYTDINGNIITDPNLNNKLNEFGGVIAQAGYEVGYKKGLAVGIVVGTVIAAVTVSSVIITEVVDRKLNKKDKQNENLAEWVKNGMK